ncbi:unnamed protein product [Withania somnifera]
MPRSSKHKSHKQSKYSPKEGRDYSYSDSDEEVKMKEKEKEKERSSKEDSLARVSKDLIHSGSGEKRKHSSQSKEGGKDGKDLSGYGNGDASEEYVSSSKRRKEKAEMGSCGADRWNGAGDSAMKGESLKIDADKGSKGKETKSSSDSKSKNSKKEGSIASLVEKEESKSGRVESKRKSEKDSARKEGKDSKEVKEKERGSDREKKGHESKRDDVDNVKKLVSQSGDVSEEKQNKKEWSVPNEAPNLDLDKDAERRARKRREVPGDRDKYEDDINESDDRRLSSRSERTKDEKQRYEKHKEYKEDGDKDDRHKDDRYHEDVDKDRKCRDDKYREDSDRDNRHRDDKYLEDVDRDSRRRDDKYRDDGDRDSRRKDDRYREDDERDSRRRDDKYREDGDNDNRHGNGKYREYGEKDGCNEEDRYNEDGERVDRQRDIKYREDSERDKRRKDEKHRDDFERHGRFKDVSEADESDKKRRLNDAKYGDERAPRDHSGDRSDAKRSRDEDHVSGLHLRKSGLHEGNPGYDRARYKDEPGRRRMLDKEDLGDIRSRSSKELRSETEKRSISSARVESVTDRGRSTSRNADVELAPKKSRWKTSPSAGPHTTRDNYRLSKQEESKYREYPYEERIRHGGTSRDYAGSGASGERISSTRSTEKMIQKEDIFLVDFSAERRLKSDVRSSPLQLVDRSPSSASNERRHLNRSEVRRSLDVEDSTQRSGGGSREVKEGRGNRDIAGDAFAGDEPSQMDGDNVSVSSPFIGGNHFPGSSKSALPPPPPFRSGVDSPSMFGSLEVDSRGKSTNRHRRISDPNIGRMQGNAWKGVPNWSSPLANGFMPFLHGPPPVGFHPAMQQFPGPPMFGVRPSMDLSHPGVPYHMPDADRFSGHGRPMGWRTPLDDSCGPPLHGWDANNFGEEAHLYGRPDWDQTRSLSNNSRSWETINDLWKGPIRGTSEELPSGSQKEACSIQGPENSFAVQSAQQAQSEQKQTDQHAESNDISQSSSVPGRSTLEDLKINHEDQPIEVKSSMKEEPHLCNVYLKKLDISADLTEPELFDQCTSLMDVEQILTSDVDSSKILFLEGAVESNVTLRSKFSSVPLLASVADSVFQKAISLYKKGREEIKITNGGDFSFSGQLGESCPAPKLENSSSEHGKVQEPALVDEGLAEDGDEGVDLPVSSEEAVELPQTTVHELCEPMALTPTEKSDLPSSMDEGAGMQADTVVDVARKSKIAENSSSPEEVGQSALTPLVCKDLMRTDISVLADVKEEKFVDANCGPLPHPGVSSEVFEAGMAESIESESVNLSRIHHSPESTH